MCGVYPFLLPAVWTCRVYQTTYTNSSVDVQGVVDSSYRWYEESTAPRISDRERDSVYRWYGESLFELWSNREVTEFPAQRVLIIWFGSSPTPPPLPPPSVSSTVDTHEDSRKRDNLLAGRGGGRGRSQTIQRWESLVLYKNLSKLSVPPRPFTLCFLRLTNGGHW